MNKRKFYRLSVEEQVRYLFTIGIPVKLFDSINNRWIYPIQDTVRTKSGQKLTHEEIWSIIDGLSPADHAAAQEATRQILERAKQITKHLQHLNLPLSAHYNGYVLWLVDSLVTEIKYKVYYFDDNDDTWIQHESSVTQRLREILEEGGDKGEK